MIRKLKISTHTTFSKSNLAYRRGKAITRPALAIRGKWLEDAGFSPYQHVQVQVSDKQLIIQLIS